MTTAKPPANIAKSNAKKKSKVLSQAALKRLEKEQQEAAKTVTEKLAESIKSKKTASSKHNTVVDKTNSVKARNTPLPKEGKVIPAKKVSQQKPMNRATDHDVFLARIDERDNFHRRLFKQAEDIRNRLEKINNRETTKFNEALRDCYGIYAEVETSRDKFEFYETVKGYFKIISVPYQANTPESSLLVRFILPIKKKDPSNKSDSEKKLVSEFGTVIRYAYENKIAKNNFIDWYQRTTKSRILASARKSSTANSKELLSRARIALMRYFDLKEQEPLGHFEYPEYLANKQVHLPDGLIFVICRGVQLFNRDVSFDPENPSESIVPMASIAALHFIPPNVELANDLINRLARHFVPYIDEVEEQLIEKTKPNSTSTWANDISNLLMERELSATYKDNDKWADRMQAAIAEDQSAFERKRKKIQKLRDKSRK